MKELVAEGLQAGVAGGVAFLHAPGQEFLGHRNKFLPSDEHLIQEARSTGHWIVDQQIVFVVGFFHDQN